MLRLALGIPVIKEVFLAMCCERGHARKPFPSTFVVQILRTETYVQQTLSSS